MINKFDKLTYNLCVDFSNIQNLYIHELGHALGFAHREESTSVMQENVTSITDLSTGDKANYNSAYNNY